MGDINEDPLCKDDDSIAEDPVKEVDGKDGVLHALGIALVSLVSKRYTMAMSILLTVMLMGFCIIFLVPEERVQIAMNIFSFLGGFASAAVMFYMGNHNQAASEALKAKEEELNKA